MCNKGGACSPIVRKYDAVEACVQGVATSTRPDPGESECFAEDMQVHIVGERGEDGLHVPRVVTERGGGLGTSRGEIVLLDGVASIL